MAILLNTRQFHNLESIKFTLYEESSTKNNNNENKKIPLVGIWHSSPLYAELQRR